MCVIVRRAHVQNESTGTAGTAAAYGGVESGHCTCAVQVQRVRKDDCAKACSPGCIVVQEEAQRIREGPEAMLEKEAGADAVHAPEAEPQQVGAAAPQKLASSKSGGAVELTASALARMHVTPLASPMSPQQLEASEGHGLASHSLAFDSSSDC